MAVQNARWYIENSSNKAEALGKYSIDLNNAPADPKVLSDIKNATNFGSALNRGGNNLNSNSIKGTIANPMDVLRANSGNSGISEMRSEYDTSVKNLKDLLDFQKVNDDILSQLKKEADLHTIINEKMGMTGELSRDFRDTILNTVPKAATLGYDLGQIADMVTRITENSGRLNLISQETMEKALETSRAFGMTTQQMADAMGEFEKVGLGASDTSKNINKAGMLSLSLGLNSRKTTEDLRNNISKLNEYGFSKGVEGLNRMVQQSLEFRMNMSETFKVADKVMNPESAIELTANMQMLGGAIGDLNDPLKLMYMATNNVEGLQEAIQGAASGLATYNKEQGRFEITGANLRRAKEMANQLGISYSEFAKGAIAANEKIAAGEALASRGFNIDNKDREFLTNLSQMKDGQMQIVVPKSLQDSLGKQLGSNEVRLDQLTDKQLNALKEYRDELEKMTPEQMAENMFTSQRNTENYTKGTMLAVQRFNKDQLFGRQEDKNSPLQKSSNLLLNLSKEQLGASTSNPDYIKSQMTTVTKSMDAARGTFNKALDALNISTQALITEVKKFSSMDKEIEEKNKRKEKWEESAKAKNNEFVIKSQVNVVYNGFGLPQTDLKNGYLVHTGK